MNSANEHSQVVQGAYEISASQQGSCADNCDSAFDQLNIQNVSTSWSYNGLYNHAWKKLGF